MVEVTTAELDAIADRLAARLNLAIVQQIPRAVIDMLYDGSRSSQPFPGAIGGSYVVLRMGRRGNFLEVEIECNGQVAGSFRFEGAP